MYRLFYDGDKEPQALKLSMPQTKKLSSKDARVLSRLGTLLGRMKDRDKSLLVGVAAKLAGAR
jgi:hypothetical protein